MLNIIGITVRATAQARSRRMRPINTRGKNLSNGRATSRERAKLSQDPLHSHVSPTHNSSALRIREGSNFLLATASLFSAPRACLAFATLKRSVGWITTLLHGHNTTNMNQSELLDSFRRVGRSFGYDPKGERPRNFFKAQPQTTRIECSRAT